MLVAWLWSVQLQRSKAKEPVASVNIWDEEESDATIRYDSDVPVKAGELPAIAAATFNKLVDRLTSFEAPGSSSAID